ncbi:calpain family cysteine protease [Coniochaeta sp. 2T2.1]|nr:calpain family cysteine protease [Coniochaeta sp. 2T2.1]
MSVLSALGGRDGPGGGANRTVMAEMPVVLQPPSHRGLVGKQKSPQEKVDRFWKKFTTEAPGKATSVIPKNKTTSKPLRGRSNIATSSGTTTTKSYEEAAAICRAKVEKIVKECRRINQKYRDPHFDLEFDLKMNRRDCLDPLDNTRPCPPPFRFTPKAVKRVCEIFDDPTFYIDGPTANDVRQGRDGDCWLMAALCTLSNKPGLIERVCVARDEAVGVYGFVFHRDGEWISEIIDDKLYLTKPDYDEVNLERIMWEDRDRVNSEETYRKTYQANSGALYFAQCENPNETWLPLLEKAYAKAHGDYSAIEGGFTGEGIEDLTGGVTSELFTTDILDKEYFWKEELMKVNEQFLFGCSTGVWGRGWGERKGIMELHAYSIMRAVEVDGERLVLLKNPWGKGEWNGPWSDGSKEWTPEWLKKLNHRFGDDGAFWISYDDLLRKYQAFDRTRLFGPDWKVTSVWTTLSVPWTLEYHDTKFAFTLTKPGPVVLVLSQLDDRYFRGLEGQYRFELSFRLHPAGEEDYVVRSQTTYRMNRSVNVELELEPGEYHVLVKIDATRDYSIMPPEDVVRANAKEKREKLIRIGLAYDVAHSKGKIVETPEEKAARVAYEKYKRDKEKKDLRERIMKERQRDHYVQVKRLAKNRKVMEKRRAKQKAREEKARAEEERLMAERGPPPPPPPPPGTGGDPPNKKGEKTTGDGKTGEKKADAQVQNEDKPKEEQDSKNAEAPVKGADEKAAETAEQTKADVAAKDETVKDGESSVGQGEHTPTSTVSEKSVDQNADKGNTGTSSATPTHQATSATEPTAAEDFVKPLVTDAQGAYISDNDSLSDISSPSDLSDRELEYHLENEKSRTVRVPLPPPPMGLGRGGVVSDSEDDEFERDPWNAVAVVGFRVYYRVAEGTEEKEETVQIRVIRPVWFPVEKDGEERKKKVVLEGKVKETGMDESMVLDLDDSAKDATLLAGEKGVVEDVKEETKENGNDVGKKEDDAKKVGDVETKDAKAEDVEAVAENGVGVKAEEGDSKDAETKKREGSEKDSASEESGKQT